MINNFHLTYTQQSFISLKEKISNDEVFTEDLLTYLKSFIDSKFKPKNLDFWLNLLPKGKLETLSFLNSINDHSIKEQNPFIYFLNNDDKNNILKKILEKKKK